MISLSEIEPLLRMPQVDPKLLRKQAASLRQRSRQCSDLADTSITADAKHVFSSLAEQLGNEADQLEDALVAMRRIYGGGASSEPAPAES